MTAVSRAGGEVIAAAALVDRSNGAADLGVPFFPLVRLNVPSYPADVPAAGPRRHSR
jgi:orotate phosphoribosyltransferase